MFCQFYFYNFCGRHDISFSLSTFQNQRGLLGWRGVRGRDAAERRRRPRDKGQQKEEHGVPVNEDESCAVLDFISTYLIQRGPSDCSLHFVDIQAKIQSLNVQAL